jgi:D-lactate dehydrogenase
MSSTKEQAVALLKSTSYFHDSSKSLLDALASKMVPVEAEAGHIFVDEGEPMTHLLIIEEGTLVRTKLAVAESGREVMRTSLKDLTRHKRAQSQMQVSVVVDEVKGRGRITGLLHSIKEGGEAYATVSSKGRSKVWLIAGEDFRQAVSSPPEHCLDILYSMSRELRLGSKSLRGLVQKLKHGGEKDPDDKNSKQTCRVLCYDATSWVTEGFKPAVEAFNKAHREDSEEYNAMPVRIEMDFTTERLGERSATFAAGYDAVCLFVNDTASDKVIQTLSLLGVKLIAMRCAGFDRVDGRAALAYGMTVARVPAYSPYAVAEHAVALLMAVNRKISKASNRVKMANFTLDAGLMGMDIHGKTVGVMGTGKIGQILFNIMLGFGAELLCYDVFENEEIKQKGGKYVSKDEIYERCDVIFLMMPLLPATHHTINREVISKLKKGVILINTSRGGLVDTQALLAGLRSEIVGGVGIDVYEHEQDYFFQDWSARNVKDPDLVALLGHNNVILTAHQAFFTKEAVDKIVSTTLDNIRDFKYGMTSYLHPNSCLPMPEKISF